MLVFWGIVDFVSNVCCCVARGLAGKVRFHIFEDFIFWESLNAWQGNPGPSHRIERTLRASICLSLFLLSVESGLEPVSWGTRYDDDDTLLGDLALFCPVGRRCAPRSWTAAGPAGGLRSGCRRATQWMRRNDRRLAPSTEFRAFIAHFFVMLTPHACYRSNGCYQPCPTVSGGHMARTAVGPHDRHMEGHVVMFREADSLIGTSLSFPREGR
jgi:hypothetical protein